MKFPIILNAKVKSKGAISMGEIMVKRVIY